MDKYRFKIKFELIIRKLVVYLLILSCIFGYAFILGKERETLFMMIAYTLTRNLFDRQLHMSTAIKCIKVSIIVFVISITAIINYNLSIMESALIGVVINFIGNVLTLIPVEEIKKKKKRQRILEIVNNDEEAIDKICKELGLIDLSETIYLYLNNTIEDVSDILQIDTTTVTRRINRFLKAAKCLHWSAYKMHFFLLPV